RPSTYAPTISTIQKRGYVVKEDREGKIREYRVLTLEAGKNDIASAKATEITGAEKNKLFPSDVGAVVNDFLLQHFHGIMDYNFTANVEKEFDEIAQGMKEWTRMLEEFYGPFHRNVEETIEKADKATGERELGTDPASGKRVTVRIGRYGPFVQLGENSEEEKPRYASLRGNQSIETISLEEALELFKLPKKIGTFEEKEMQVNIGRFGPYILHDKKFYSVPKGLEPLDINEQQAIEIILEKRKNDAEKTIKTFSENPDVKILNGRWGPFIAFGKQNVKIPKGTEPSSLSYEDCVRLAEESKSSPKAGPRSKSKRKKN
ncbi:MAG TPA: topoisomerase C-terminal repeat-containing protein, partial [Anseongella sp.]|nr:topoisomerase C-terminal repeat-containing protein [Anseongella sp.]